MNLERASAIIASGTAASRVTGLVRNIVLVALIGSNRSEVADAFDIANNLPNTIFELISVGLFSALIVPQVVKARSDSDGGNGHLSKLYTLAVSILLVATAVATAAAPWLVSLQIQSSNTKQLALATAFAYWCLPQIFFYGLYALIGETFNGRRLFGPATWSPVVNNVISIAGFVALGVVFGHNLSNVEQWTPTMVSWLGGLATAGIAAQTAVLLLFWHKTQLALRIDFKWRGAGLRTVGHAVTWTLLMALTSIVTGYFQSWIANIASGDGPAVAVMNNAWLVFIFPYSLIVYSIGTPYFVRIAESATRGDDHAVRADVSQSIRLLGFFVVGAGAALAAAAIPVSRIFTNSASDAVEAATVLSGYLVGLLPLAMLFILHRTFFAYGDTRTPFFYNLVQCILVAAATVLAWQSLSAGILDVTALAATLALGQSIAGFVQTGMAAALLRRRLGHLHARRWLTSIIRYVIAAVPAVAGGRFSFALIGGAHGWATTSIVAAIFSSLLVGIVTVVIYLAALVLLRAPEIKVGFAALFPRRS